MQQDRDQGAAARGARTLAHAGTRSAAQAARESAQDRLEAAHALTAARSGPGLAAREPAQDRLETTHLLPGLLSARASRVRQAAAVVLSRLQRTAQHLSQQSVEQSHRVSP